MALLKHGGLEKKYPISTSKFGLGDRYGSYKTPLGLHRVCEKIGNGQPLGAVFKTRHPTGEILPVNAPGRDPIVTRILWLEGLESHNSNAKSRGIYIHGTVEEARLGEPVSYGCIRMRSRDVVEVFDETPVGTPVEIITEKFPRFRKPAPPKPEILIAKNDRPAPAPAKSETADSDGLITRVGPKGQITVIARRMTEVASANQPDAKVDRDEPRRMRMVLAPKVEPKAPVLAKAPTKETPAPKTEALVAQTGEVPGLLPVAAGGEPKEEQARPAEPRVILSLKDSILFAGLPSKPKPVPAPAPEPFSQRTQMISQDGPRVEIPTLATETDEIANTEQAPEVPVDAEEQPLQISKSEPAEEAAQLSESAPVSETAIVAHPEPAWLSLQMEAPDVLLGILDLRRRELPLDSLSASLLAEESAPQRLAFRTSRQVAPAPQTH